VTDVSALGNVYELRLAQCAEIRDVVNLENVRELHLGDFKGSDVSGLKNVQKLFLYRCEGIADISMLINIEVLGVSGCPGIVLSQLSGMEKLKELRFRANDDQPTRNLPVSVLERLSKFKSMEMDLFSMDPSISLNNLHELTLRLCNSFSKLLTNPTLSHLRSLKLSYCYDDFSFLPELPSLGDLTIEFCDRITFLQLRGVNAKFPIYSVNIYNCKILREVGTTRNVSEMKISYCPQLYQLNAEKQIGFLKVNSCQKLEVKGECANNIVLFHDITPK
jgi:hypothetical protein